MLALVDLAKGGILEAFEVVEEAACLGQELGREIHQEIEQALDLGMLLRVDLLELGSGILQSGLVELKLRS